MQMLLSVAVLFIYDLFMVEHSVPALEVVLIFITIYLHNYFFIFIENCPKLRASKPNFGQILICYFRPKLHFCSLTSDTETSLKKTINSSEQININNFDDLVCIFDAVKLKTVR